MRRVAVFARRPVPGKVKTRLSPALPPEMACLLYRGMLADAIAAASGSRLADERFVYWAEEGSEGDAGGLAERVQRGGDLGERLTTAFEDLIAEPGDHAVVIGADCPMLDGGVVDEAFERLAEFEGRGEPGVVIAPTRDGGYALIGLTRRAPSLFRGILWGSEAVMAETLERARAAEMIAGELASLEDVDLPEDLLRLVGLLASRTDGRGSGTRIGLERCGLLPEGVGSLLAART